MDEEPVLHASIRALAAESRRGLAPHPSPDELLDYQAGDLSPQQREGIQDHLALCPECARAVLDLSRFPDVEPARQEDRLADADVAAEWRRFRERAGVAPALHRPPRVSRFASPRLAYALAASLLLAVLGLSLWISRLRGEVRALAEPTVNVVVADLVPREQAGERSAGDEETIGVPAWADRLLLILNLAEAAADGEYRVVISTVDGTRLWSRRGLRPSADGNFTLEVPRRLLPAGPYRIRLYGPQGSTAPAAEYAIRIGPG